MSRPPLASGGIIVPKPPKRGLTRAQIERLRQPIDPDFVEKKQNLSYISQHEVRAELTRIFGYGNWDSTVDDMQFIYEYEVKKGDLEFPAKPKTPDTIYYRVCYRARVTLNIRDYWGNHVASFSEWHAEANSVLPDRGEAHAMAMTSVESYALRRCAINLGDRLGLGLYNKGSLAPLVKNSLQFTDPDSPLALSPEETERRRQEQDKAAQAGRARMQAAINDGSAQ